MRSRRIEFEATGMRPNTKLYVFMDGINISDLQGPSTLTGKTSQQDMIETDVESKEIISDRNGSASGFFFIPSFKEAVFSANAAAIISGLQTIGEGTYADLQRS